MPLDEFSNTVRLSDNDDRIRKSSLILTGKHRQGSTVLFLSHHKMLVTNDGPTDMVGLYL